MRATHQSTSVSSAADHRPTSRLAASPEPMSRLRAGVMARACQRRRIASAHRQASTIVASRNGPAATFWLAMCGASEVHAVGWLMTGESGWLVTDDVGVMPVGDRRRAEQHRRRERRADEERHHSPPRQYREHHRQREQHQGLNADRRAGQPARQAEPPPALREDRVKQQPDGDRVLRVAPAGGDRPQDARARGGEQAALPEAHAELLRERVGGEQRDAAQRDLVRPGHQPDRRVQVMRARDAERQAERRDQRPRRAAG